MRRTKEKNKFKQYEQELLTTLERIAPYRALFHDFLRDLLTPREYEELVLRWQIVQRLFSEEPQRDIVNELRVAVATVTRGSRALCNERGGFSRVLQQYGRKM